MTGAAQTANAAKARPAGGGGVMAPIHQFTDDFNKGDIAGAKADNADVVSIVDDFSPHLWTGPGAYDTWLAGLITDDKARGETGEKVILGATVRFKVGGDTAYVVTRATDTYKQHGKKMAAPGEWTFALHNVGGAWKITAWTWSGGAAHAVLAAAKSTAAPAAAPAAKP